MDIFDESRFGLPASHRPHDHRQLPASHELPVRQRSAAKRHEGAAAQSSAQMPSPNPAHTAAYQWYAGTQGEKALEYVFDKFTNIADSGVEMSRETDTQDITLNFKYQGQHLQVNFPYNFPRSSSLITSGGDRIVIGGDTTETAVSAIINSISSVKPQAHLRSNPAHMAADQWYAVKQGVPMDEELEELGQKIAGDWERLGRRLHIDDAKLQEIQQAHDQLSEKGYHMLRHWKQDKGSAATYQALRDALQHKLVQRQDLAEQFCYNHGTFAIQLPADPVPEEKETRKIPPATAATCEVGASSKDQEESSGVRSGLKRQRSKPNPERGNLSFKIRCASAFSRNSGEQDPQQARKKVNRYMEEKAVEAVGKFDLSSYTGLRDMYVYLVGELHLVDVNFDKGSIKITVKCGTLEILERLCDDYRSGHLNKVAEECLITEKVKDELDMETITLMTTILKEDYLACKLSLMEIPDEASAGDGQVELRGDLESREHELEELEEPTACADVGQVELRGDLESREQELEELKELTVEASADNGQVELRGDLESREHELEELKEPTDEASANDGKAERRGDLESREHELEELEEPTVEASADDGQVGLRGDVESREHELEELKEPTDFAEEELPKLGVKLVDVGSTDTGLGPVKHDRGDLQQAKEHYERTLDIRLKKLGPDHADVARSYFNIGNVQYQLGDLKQAKENFDRTLDIRLKKLGPDHFDVACTYNNLGAVQHDLGDLQQAKELYERALDIQLKNLGPDHADVARTYYNIGKVQRDLGDLQQAKELYERALSIRLKKLGPDHVDVARTYNNLGAIQRHLGDLQQAKELCERALDIRLKKFGPEHAHVAASYSNLAIVQRELGDLQEAKENFERALDIRLRKLGPFHVDVARTNNSLAAVQRDLGDLRQARKAQLLDIRQQELEPKDVDVAQTYTELGVGERDLGNVKQEKKT
ncbi:uncharacterized protein LOC144655131 [Oculina patagonica]